MTCIHLIQTGRIPSYAIIGQRKKKKFQLGDEVQIRMMKVDLDKRQIDFTSLSYRRLCP
ncbi:hypothetical protein [Sphingobacterium sp. GVS05A]|uniref:hypothetical protein n=1 Tax=Sphingobacterium sp. GVS05A TaxID=2862679 RepID=UPI000FB869A0|nr:hypothetical protein [Sphingobacterium sp. GVS05A]